MGEYVNVTDVFRTLDLVMSDDNIKHKGKAIRKRLKELPTEDVEKVVRCKDWEYFSSTNYNINKCEEHSDYTVYVGENDYCSYGERKEGAEEC